MARHEFADSDDRPSGEQHPGDGGPVETEPEKPARPALIERVRAAWATWLVIAALLAAGGAIWRWNADKATRADVAREHERVEELDRRITGQGGVEERLGKMDAQMQWMTGAVWAIAIKTGADVPPPPK